MVHFFHQSSHRFHGSSKPFMYKHPGTSFSLQSWHVYYARYFLLRFTVYTTYSVEPMHQSEEKNAFEHPIKWWTVEPCYATHHLNSLTWNLVEHPHSKNICGMIENHMTENLEKMIVLVQKAYELSCNDFVHMLYMCLLNLYASVMDRNKCLDVYYGGVVILLHEDSIIIDV